MYFAVRSVKEPTRPICSNVIIYNNCKCLAISYGKIVKFYGLDVKRLKLIDSIFPGAYVCQIIPFKNDYYLLVSKDSQFVLMKDKIPVKKGRISQEYVTNDSHLLKICASNEEFAIFVFGNSKMCIFNFTGNHLRINENIKEFLAYVILDVALNKNELICLVKDSEERVYIHRYFIREGNREIVYKDRKMFKNAKKIFFSFGLLYVFRDNIIFIMDKNDKITETVFANSGILSGTPWNHGLLLSSEDGEIIHLKRVGLDVLMTTNVRFQQLLIFEQFIFGRSENGKSSLIALNEKSICDRMSNVSHLRSLDFKNGLRFLSGCAENDKICTLKYRIPVKKEKMLDCLTDVKKFWVFKECIYASFVGYSILFKEGMFHNKMDEILNFKAFDEYCVLNTAKSIIRISDITKKIDFPGIILSDIQKNEIFVYTDQKGLFLIKTADFTAIKKVLVADEVSLIKCINQMYIVSTFTSKLKFLDNQLKLMKTENCPAIVYCEQLDDLRLIIAFTSGKICCLNLDSQKMEILFIFKGVKGLIKKDDDVYLFGKNVIKITPNLECFTLNLQNVQYLAIDLKNILICEKSNIFTVQMENLPTIFVKKRSIPDSGLSFCSNKTQKVIAHRNEDSSTIVYKTKITNVKVLSRHFRRIYYTNNKRKAIKKRKISSSSDSYNSEKLIKPSYKIEINKSEMDLHKLIVQCIKFYKNFLIVGANMKSKKETIFSKLILFDGLESINEITKAGHIVDFSIYKDHILTSHGAVITVYKIQNKKFVELAQASMTIEIWKMHIHRFQFIVANMWRSFVLMEFDPKINIICEKSRFYDNIMINAGAIYKNYFILSEKTLSLSIYIPRSNDYEIARVSTMNLNEEITAIKKGSLNTKIDRAVHYAISLSGAIFAIKIYKKNYVLEAISRVIRKVGEKMLFNHKNSLKAYDKIAFKNSAHFIDCDILKYHPGIDKCIDKLCKNQNEIREMIRELINIH